MKMNGLTKWITACLSMMMIGSAGAAVTVTGTIGVDYNASPLCGAKVNGAYWYTVSGSLPQGLYLNSNTGCFVGNTWSDGTFPLTMTAETGSGQKQQQAVELTIQNIVPTITSATDITVSAGTIYDSTPLYQITTATPATWYEAQGLPSGLAISRDTGRITGVVSTPGVYSIGLSAKNQYQRTATATLTLRVNASQLTYTVTNTSGSSQVEGSLPWAVAQANRSGVASRIAFAMPSTGTPLRITLQERLWLNEAIAIDATTQSGYAGVPLVQVDGNGVTAIFTVVAADAWHHGGGGAEIAGLQFVNFSAAAIATQPGADNVTIRDNYIGFYWDTSRNRWWRNFEATLSDTQIQNETAPIYNGYTQAVGVGIQSSGNRILRNVISGVHNGISIGYDFEGKSSSTWGAENWNNVIANNMIGTTPDGSAILTNTSGVLSYRPDPNTSNPFGSPALWKYFGNNSDGIYLAALAKGTVISGNLSSGNFSVGIELLHETVERSQIYGNRLGTDIQGEKILPNGELGIILSNGAHDNLVGGENGANLIAGNYFGGVELGGANSFRKASYNTIQGNLIGCNATCTRALGNQTTGIHLGTSDSRMNVIEGNTVVGNDWGIYLDGANDNVLTNNFVGITRSGVSLGNAKSGIVLDNASWNSVLVNRVENNGYGITGHEDWRFGIWELNGGGGNRYYENIVANNRTGTNANQASLPACAVVDPPQGIFLACIELGGARYRGYFAKSGTQAATLGTLWRLNPASTEALAADRIPSCCMQFDAGLGFESSAPVVLGNSLTGIRLEFSPQQSDPNGFYWRQH